MIKLKGIDIGSTNLLIKIAKIIEEMGNLFLLNYNKYIDFTKK